jgi:hypothetical protein
LDFGDIEGHLDTGGSTPRGGTASFGEAWKSAEASDSAAILEEPATFPALSG